MQAFVDSIECWVVALAAASFAHFGVVLKEAPDREPAAVVQRLQVSVQDPVLTRPMSRSAARRQPCPLSKDARRA